MNKLVLTSFLLLFSVPHLFAQYHSLLLRRNCEGMKPAFNDVQIINNLVDDQLLGYVQKGVLNKTEQIVYNGSIADGISRFFKTNSYAFEEPRELVILLNEVFMSETSGPFSERAKLKLSMRFFSRVQSGGYVDLLDIDSIYHSTGLDVTKKLLNSINDELCSISQQVNNAAKEIGNRKREYSFQELVKLDSLEKLNIPVYMTNAPASGIYRDYKHLKISIPNDDCRIVIDTSKANDIKVYKIYKTNNRKIRLESEGIYAVSDGERLYKATSKSFYRLKKIGNDFYYDRPASISEINSSGVVVGQIAFGLAGALVADAVTSNSDNKSYRFKINYRRGTSVPVAIVE